MTIKIIIKISELSITNMCIKFGFNMKFEFSKFTYQLMNKVYLIYYPRILIMISNITIYFGANRYLTSKFVYFKF